MAELDISTLVDADKASSRIAVKVIVAGLALLLVGAGSGIAAVSTVNDKVDPVKKEVAQLKVEQDLLKAEQRIHEAKQIEVQRETNESLSEIKEVLKELNGKVDDVKERCIQGGGCSDRKHKN